MKPKTAEEMGFEPERCLASQIARGDTLISAALGGHWDKRVASVQPGEISTRVSFEDGSFVWLGSVEVCAVKRGCLCAGRGRLADHPCPRCAREERAEELVGVLKAIGGLNHG